LDGSREVGNRGQVTGFRDQLQAPLLLFPADEKLNPPNPTILRLAPQGQATGTKDTEEEQDAKGQIVGYFIVLLLRHPHYSRAGLMAITDVYYLAPEHRKGGAGAKMLIELEKSLKGKAVKAYVSAKIHDGNDHQRLFEALNWRFTDKAFTKILR
jgi:GNAT superfamily N-acetyltransferase